MTMSFYVSPEQQMKDRADFARKGIARGRSVAVLRYADGVLFVAENHSGTLHKVSEIYDRIGFAAVGRYNEFEMLRVAGIQQADVRGFTYDRADVTARALVNTYAQVLGAVFASSVDKPLEVELVVAEVGADPSGDQLFRIAFDGSVADERHFAVIGGNAEAISARLTEGFGADAALGQALRHAVGALREQAPAVETLEVAVLDRTRAAARTFERLPDARVRALLEGDA